MRVADMLTIDDFADVGLDLVARRTDVRLELVVCEKAETLDNIALSGPPVQRSWEAGSVVAYQQAIAARDEDEATAVVKRIVRKLEACQHKPPPSWLYGPTHTERLGPGLTATWLGRVDGELNVNGRAPKGEQINGGIGVLRHGSHVAVLSISFCASAGDGGACVVADGDAYDQLAALSRAGARRLG